MKVPSVSHKHREPHLYLEHSRLCTKDGGVVCRKEGEEVSIPVAMYSSILLGPGTSLTHEAVLLCHKAGTSLVWVGAECSQLWTSTVPRYDKSQRLLYQLGCHLDRGKRRRVARALYAERFGSEVAPEVTIREILGMEGARCRKRYRELSERYQVPWDKRVALKGDGINRSIDVANGSVIGAAMCAVMVAGYSPSIGFLHSGFSRAFACDIADVFKFEYGVEEAFACHSEGVQDRRAVRQRVKARMGRAKLVSKMIDTAIRVIDAGVHS